MSLITVFHFYTLLFSCTYAVNSVGFMLSLTKPFFICAGFPWRRLSPSESVWGRRASICPTLIQHLNISPEKSWPLPLLILWPMLVYVKSHLTSLSKPKCSPYQFNTCVSGILHWCDQCRHTTPVLRSALWHRLFQSVGQLCVLQHPGMQ